MLRSRQEWIKAGRWGIALVGILSSLACSLAVGPLPSPTPFESDVVVGEITQLDEPPPTRTPFGATPVVSELGPTPLPGAESQIVTVSNSNCETPVGWGTYTIQEGDYLSILALRYNTTVESLMAVNCIEDARFLQLGQVIAVPGSGDTVIGTETDLPPLPTPILIDNDRVLAAPATVDLFFVLDVPDGRVGGIEAGCGQMLVPIPRTVQGADTPENRVRSAVEAMLAERASQVDRYRNPLQKSSLTLESFSLGTGIARVGLRGTLSIADVCEAPLVRGQIEQTVLADNAVNQVIVTLNGVPIDAAMPTS
jgi:LysM repeat protein